MQSTVVYLGLLSAILLSVQAVPYPGPNPYARPVANPLALPYAYPEPNCCGAGSRCGLGLCDCCGGTTCENGACNPIRVTDFLDGWIARTFPNQASRVGSFLDPLADKVLITTLFLTLTYSGLMPIPLTLLVVTRDAILLSAGLYIRFHSLPPPRTFRRLVDLSHATAQLSPTLISKVNTAVQLITVGATLAATLLPFPHDDLLILLWCFAASTTIASAMSYVFAKDTYVVLRSR
ncbi:cardiolipin synthase (CMP-forming) isoform X1 [Homalodisca vitripennis]|uniref:cardiolipin synthase (CMP-forming) isoform X1 n=1 Tax=Homalodisca vitripennis TaxID=197043 RepID=UPI001EEABC21|nr:cardiolipin synthase (CMP-forming) isoform X1 [Homalodisca vitripennis]